MDAPTRNYVVLQRRAAELVVTTQFGSAGQLQRKLGVSRMVSVALILDLEEQGIVGRVPELGKSRDVLIPFPGVPALRELIDRTFPLPDEHLEDDGV
jgi:DNA segregation ATPase FtsK/SpoIIIE-like protein